MTLSKRTKESASTSTGVWLTTTEPKGDVHVYTMNGGIVIRQNKDYNDKIDFSDLALVFGSDQTIRLQYADDKGRCQSVDAPEKLVRSKILALLTALREELAD